MKILNTRKLLIFPHFLHGFKSGVMLKILIKIKKNMKVEIFPKSLQWPNIPIKNII